MKQTLFEELDVSLSAFGETNKKNSIAVLDRNGVKYNAEEMDFEKAMDVLSEVFESYSDVMFNRIYWNVCSRLDRNPDRRPDLSPKEKILNLLKNGR